jgi:F-type H+-transporting ATPase subunit beta
MGYFTLTPWLSTDLGTEIAKLEERICNTATGAITSVQAVYVPADDFTDPSAVHTFSHLSASIVLSRKRASEGLLPAIDPLQSGSRMLVPHLVEKKHYHVAQEIRKTLATYEDLKDIIAMLGIEELSKETGRLSIVHGASTLSYSAIFRNRTIYWAEGKTVSREDAIEGCERILTTSSLVSRTCCLHDRNHQRGSHT